MYGICGGFERRALPVAVASPTTAAAATAAAVASSAAATAAEAGAVNASEHTYNEEERQQIWWQNIPGHQKMKIQLV